MRACVSCDARSLGNKLTSVVRATLTSSSSTLGARPPRVGGHPPSHPTKITTSGRVPLIPPSPAPASMRENNDVVSLDGPTVVPLNSASSGGEVIKTPQWKMKLRRVLYPIKFGYLAAS